MQEETVEHKEDKVEVQYGEFQPVWCFCLLFVLSLGIYPFFWFYKHLRYLKDEKEMDIQPGFRILFIIFYGYSLFSTFQGLAKEHGYKNRFPMGIFFLLYLISVVSIYLDSLFILFGFFSFVFLIPPLNMMNFYYLKEQPNHEVRNGLAKDEKIFLIVIWIIFLFAIFNR